MFGKEYTVEIEVSRVAEPRSDTVEFRSQGCHYQSEFSYWTDGDATPVDVSFRVKAQTVLAKIMGALMDR
jgi:hypothetical protein